MTPEEFIFIIFYFMFCVCIVAPPSEFVYAGLTVQNIFGNFLGSEQFDFVGYHTRRTTATLLTHSLLPLGFVVGYSFVSEKTKFIDYNHYGYIWNFLVLSSLFIQIGCISLAIYWIQTKWDKHPISVRLQNLTLGREGWRSVASSINLEFRRFDKFTTGTLGRRLIVTDLWLILTSTYTIHVARQEDTHLTIVGSENHGIHYERMVGAQVLNILVTSADPRVKPFKIRLLASEYSDLREKLRGPIINVRNVVIQQSLSDQFLDAFRNQVGLNPKYTIAQNIELENCIGCMQTRSNVKLVKHCDSNSGSQPCQNCMCRPMWCLECMGKWFASRQDQGRPETWLSSKSPCPTCRATFCMLDICNLG